LIFVTPMAYLPELRLIYLPFRAMAEPTRFMLHFANIPYTDELIWGPAFQREKALDGFPFDKTPILEIDGQRIAQSGSISRYVAKLAGLYPRDPLECAFADHIFEMGQEMCTINPLINCFTGYHHQSVKFEYFRGLPRIFENLERQLGDKKYFGGVEPNFADFQMLHYLLNIFLSEDDCFSRNPTIRRYTLEMSELPGVREYLESRPELIDIGVDPKLKDKNEGFSKLLCLAKKQRNIDSQSKNQEFIEKKKNTGTKHFHFQKSKGIHEPTR